MKVVRFQFSKNPWFWLAAAWFAVLLRGLFLDVMDVDASQYASISMEMVQNGSWLQVKHRFSDYLDKPPLLFWSAGLSYLLFGFSTWAYKLPSFLGALAGVFAIYRFCKLFYSERTARHAAFILASATGFVVLCNDVRTDTLLLGTTSVAVWQLAEYLQSPRWKHLFGAFIAIGFAMMAKGPIGLVLPGLAVGTHLLLQRDWKNLFRWQWVIGLAVTALVLLPMCWGLYTQFDLHPEKALNDRISTSGLYFFFWEQSFGRITGNNVWRNDAGPFYFFHVYLWAFLPWALLLPGALWFHGRQAVQKMMHFQKTQLPEAFSLGAFLLTFIALSQAKYKLPHYIFVTLPWAAVLLASWLNPESSNEKSNTQKQSFIPLGWLLLLYTTFLLVLVLTFLLPAFVFPAHLIKTTLLEGEQGLGTNSQFLPGNLLFWCVLIGCTAFLIFRITKNPWKIQAEQLVQRGVWVALLVGFVLNFYFYPNLLPYQSTATIGRFIHETGIPKDNVAFFRRHGHALDFYSQTITERMDSAGQVRETSKNLGELWVYTNNKGKLELDSMRVSYEVVYQMGHFQTALLNTRFLNPASRQQSLEQVWLLKISGNE